MELAKNLAQWRDLSPEQWLAEANRVLPSLVVLILVVLLAWQASGLTWRLLDAPAEQDVVPIAAVPTGAGNERAGSGALDALRGWHPFGQPPPPEEAEALAAEDIIDAPLTSLNLTLHGVAQAQELPERGSRVIPEGGLAVISAGRALQRVYRPGMTIEDANGAVLHSVFTDRVLLDRGGRLESLRYPEPDERLSRGPQLNSSITSRAAPPPPAPAPAEPQGAVAMAEALNNVAPVLANHINFTSAMENGQMIGFTLQPRGDSNIFGELGFEAGDVLMEVNGLPLNNLRQTAQVFAALGESPQAQVRVRRNGQEQMLVIDMGQVERLAESLQ